MRILRTDPIDRRQLTKEIAPLSARKEIRDNIRFEQGNLKGGRIQEKDQAQKNLAQWQKLLDKNNPETMSPQTRSALWKRAKKLKDEFMIGMPSRDELHPVHAVEKNGAILTVVDEERMKTSNIIDREIVWHKKMDDKIREFKNIMRHLNPDDPNAADIEKFRPKRKRSF